MGGDGEAEVRSVSEVVGMCMGEDAPPSQGFNPQTAQHFCEKQLYIFGY